MIIVSQNKTSIVNFNCVEQIKIVKIIDKNNQVKTLQIYALGQYEYELGKYKTEERAKEVLQEIVNTYSIIGLTFEELNGGSKQRLPIYEMPED